VVVEEDDDDVEEEEAQQVVAVAGVVDVVAAAAIAWEGNPGRRWGARVLFGRSPGCPRIGSSTPRARGRPGLRGWVKGRKARETNALLWYGGNRRAHATLFSLSLCL
jgi:hypothetical protein